MPALHEPTSQPAPLTEKELEILRLLTAGHTVKTIAARLNRSEASINERLREARRKTGVGSSRELARMLAAQKNWDKNFDLSRQDAPTECAVQPETAGRPRSKGKIIMFIAVPITAIGLVAAATDWSQQSAPVQPVAAAATAQDPLVGKWSLDLSRIPANERPRRVTIAFRVMPDRKWNTQVEIVAPDGSTTQAESTAALDGVPVPVSGNMAFIDAVSLRQPEANTLVMTLNKNGAPVSTRVYTISRDRQSMTETIVWPGSDEPRMVTTYFNRIDSTWQVDENRTARFQGGGGPS